MKMLSFSSNVCKLPRSMSCIVLYPVKLQHQLGGTRVRARDQLNNNASPNAKSESV